MSTEPAGEESQYVIRERKKRDCWQDISFQNEKLDIGAKGLFSVLCDGVEMRNMGGGQLRGVMAISINDLARFMRVSEKSIRRWKDQLRRRGYIWWTKKHMPNTWDMHIIHLTCLDPVPASAFQRNFDDASWGKKDASDHAVIKSNGKTHDFPSKSESDETDLPPTPVIDTAHAGLKDLPQRSPLPPTPDLKSGESETLAGNNDRRGGSESPAGAVIQGNGRGSQSPVKESVLTLSDPLEHKKGTPPVDLAFEKWLKALDRMFESDLFRLRAEFTLELSKARTEQAKALIKRKLAAVNQLVAGPAVPEEPAKPKAPKGPPVSQRPPTEDELIASAEFDLARGKPLSPAQRKALERKGVPA